MNKAWTLAIEALSWVELQRINEDSALARTIKQLNIDDLEVIFKAKELIYEVLNRRNALDYLISKGLHPVQLIYLELGVRNFLRIFTYMSHYGEASFQVINELANHARLLLGSNSLEPVEDAIDIIPHLNIPWEELRRTEKLAYRYFHPEWYINYLKGYFDESKVIDIIKPVKVTKYIRLNTLKADENLLDLLFTQGFQLIKAPEIDNTYRVLDNHDTLVETPSYQEGEIIFQDKASVLVGEVASPQPGDLVLDICAAPGVKTSHLAQIMDNKGKIISIDYDERRLDSWRELIETMGVKNAEAVLADATNASEFPDVMADLVLIDPPCTGTGTFNDYPSGKWRINENSIHRMASLQKKIIDNAGDHVTEGGSLIYSTCTITYEENEGIIKYFLRKHPSFSTVEATPRMGEKGLNGLLECQRLYPYLHESQGFFIAKLVKSE